MNQQIFLQDMNDIANLNLPYKNLQDSVILVTGANGFLPAYLIESLLFVSDRLSLNIQILGVVRNLEKARKRFSKDISRKGLKLIQHDVNNKFSYEGRVDHVIHAASQASPVFYKTDPVGTLKANVLGTLNFIELAKEKAASFLFFSSGEVYGEVPSEKIPILETTFGYLNPASVRACYGESKRMAENICVSYHQQFQVATKIVRPFHTYGPGMMLDDGRVFSDFVANILDGKNIVMKSDGSARRPFCYLSDAIAGFLTVLLKGEAGDVYNVGNPEQEVSILELAEILVELFPEKKLKVQKVVRSANDPYMVSPISRNSPNVDKLKNLGWSAKHSIQSGFKRTVESFYVSERN
jgi:nucleoside-diphosphate-sugar epimerase